MLFDYMLNLENLCITQFADLLQRNRRNLDHKDKGSTDLSGHDSFSRRKEEETYGKDG